MQSKITANLLSIACLSVLATLSGGCGLGPRPQTSYEANSQVLALSELVVFQDSTGALSYQAPTGQDVRIKLAPRVKGKACQHGIQLPLPSRAGTGASLSAGWGRGAYREALSEARAGLPKEAVLFDVRADLNQFAILTVYRRQCLLIDAAVAVPIAPGATEPAPSPALPATLETTAPRAEASGAPLPPVDPAAAGATPPPEAAPTAPATAPVSPPTR